MHRNIRTLLLLCLLVTLGVLCLQIGWVAGFYRLNRDRFDKEVNLALEAALNVEFEKRNDSIENHLYWFLMDTAEITLLSRKSDADGRMMYFVQNAHNPKDRYSFSRNDFSFALGGPNDPNRKKVALAAAHLNREDLDHRYTFYLTQNLGRHLQGLIKVWHFDTARLRPYVEQALGERGIHEAFAMYLYDSSEYPKGGYQPERKPYLLTTRPYPTYENRANANFVRLHFAYPEAFLFSRMYRLVLGSALLVVLVTAAFVYLLRIINRQKKLSVIRNDFINHITHEFKTPIAVVHSALQALEEPGIRGNAERSDRYLQLSKKELLRLSDLVTKILNLSLFENPRFRMNEAPVNLALIVADLLESYRQILPPTDRIIFQNNSDSAEVTGDSLHLRNSVNNLIENAIKFSAPPRKIEIVLHSANGLLELSVADNGPGITKEYQEFVFEKFFRVPGMETAAIKGHGLGLSYVKEVAEKHKGWCRFQSNPGKGATFILGIPLHDK